jgi:hypothetical protein
MQNRTRKTNRKKAPRRPKNEGVMRTEGPRHFKGMALVFPPRMSIKLKFWTNQTLSLAASLGANYRWRPSAAFDVDPALGGTAMPGFAEAATFYATYRVISSRIKVTASNPSSTLPITLIVLPLNADPTNAMSVPNIIACSGNPYAKMKIIGLLGANPAVVNNSMTTQKIYGDPAVFYDHNFTSLVTTVPANNWFWNVAIYSSAVIATPVVINTEVEVDCEFYDRIFLPN